MPRLECPRCHGTLFRIQVPPKFRYIDTEGHLQERKVVEKGNRFIYILCESCQKLFRIAVNVIDVNEGFAEECKVEIVPLHGD